MMIVKEKPLITLPSCTTDAEARDLASRYSRRYPIALVSDPSTGRRAIYRDREEFHGMEVMGRFEKGEEVCGNN